jgi:ABC-2 type transport system permease protein
MNLRRLWAISSKEIKQLVRERGTISMIVMIPIVELLLFGYAINTDVRHLPAAVVDQSQSAFSRYLIEDVAATQVVDFVASVATVEELESLIRRGEVSVGLFIPEDAQRRNLQPGRKVAQLLIDGSDPVIAGVIAKLQAMPVGLRRFDQARFGSDSFELRIQYNPEKRSAVNIVPGLIGLILTLTMVLFTAIAIVREKEHGTLELLIATPVSVLELMVGKVMPYIAIGLIQASLILGLGYWVFNVPINGTLLDIYLATLLFIAASLTLGLVISTAAQTQFQAMQMTIFVFMPSILLSGFMFPFAGMPVVAQWIAEVLPLTHFLRIIRGVVLRGASLGEMLTEVFILIGFTAITLSIAALRFNKRLD